MVVHPEPLSRATAERVSVTVAQLELDVLVIGFNGSRTNPEFLCDPAGSETGTAQCKDMQLAIGQVRYLRMCCRAVNNLVNSAQSDPRANVKLTCEDSTMARINSSRVLVFIQYPEAPARSARSA